MPVIASALFLSPLPQGNKAYIYPVGQDVSHCWSHPNISTHDQFHPDLMAWQSSHETWGAWKRREILLGPTEEELDTRESHAGHQVSLVVLLVKWLRVFLTSHPACLAGTLLLSRGFTFLPSMWAAVKVRSRNSLKRTNCLLKNMDRERAATTVYC